MKLVRDAATSRRLGLVKQEDTKPEMVVRSALSSLGARFRTQARDLPGSPDIVNRSRKWAVFVHGCFWHRHRGCSRATTPKRNRAFWVAKFKANQLRDERAQRALRASGFAVLTVWECECPDVGKLRQRLDRFLRRSGYGA